MDHDANAVIANHEVVRQSFWDWFRTLRLPRRFAPRNDGILV